MRYHLLGRSGLRVSELFLGTMTFGDAWGWGAPPDECRRMLDTYAAAGGNMLDTANRYTDGQSEEILGELIAPERDWWVVGTKYTISTKPEDPNASGNQRKNLTRSLEASLRRLRTDRVDVYWVHLWDPDTPLEETMRALDDAVATGKVLYVGISDAPAWVVARANTLAEWRGWNPFVGLQVPYSLVRRDVERELLPMAEAFGMSVAAWGTLAGGVLSGKFTRADPPAGDTRVKPENIKARDLAIAQAVDGVAGEVGSTSTQVAIAWTRARRPWVHPIIGARTAAQLADNLAAADLELPAELLDRLDVASAIDLGFPSDMVTGAASFAYGQAGEQTVHRSPGS